MKGKLWELGPFFIAAALAIYYLFGRPSPVGAPVEMENFSSAPHPATPRESTGAGDPTKPSDFLPDSGSKPDPNSRPDPSLSTATRRAPK